MPITFKTKSYTDITMLTDVGQKMLTMMHFGNIVPGAIFKEDVGQALSNLQACIDIENTQIDSNVSEDENERVITLSTRALPLLKLLQSAYEDGHDVSWR